MTELDLFENELDAILSSKLLLKDDFVSNIRDGISLQIDNVPTHLVLPLIKKIETESKVGGLLSPIVISMESPTLKEDVKAVEDKAMQARRSRNPLREADSPFYIWVNPDHVVGVGVSDQFPRVGKYARNIFIFDHPYKFSDLTHELKSVLSSDPYMKLDFEPVQKHYE